MLAFNGAKVLVIALLLIVSGLFASAEISFLALGRHRGQRLSGGIVGGIIDRLISRPAATLGACAIVIVSVTLSIAPVVSTRAWMA